MKEEEREITKRAKKMARRYPGMRPVLCDLCREPGGTLMKQGTTNDGKRRYVHKGPCPKKRRL